MDSNSQELEQTLQKPDIHNEWENAYRTPENALFYDQAFAYIAGNLEAPQTLTMLDAGCGICDYSLRLAQHNFRITAVDFSESVLENAEANVRAHGFQEKITLQRENLLSLSFADETFDCILCWGVLMHIPDIELAIAELSRVLKPGGTLVISESNMASVESRLLSGVKRLLGRQRDEVVETEAGMEYWATSPCGKLLSRQTNIRWLIGRFATRGLAVQRHVAGQFTEIYSRFSSKIVRIAIHGFNKLWFQFIQVPGPAFGNILFFRKRS